MNARARVSNPIVRAVAVSVLSLAGLAGASAMILPGVSGGYLLLVLGQYVPILSGIDAFKDALSARDLGAAMNRSGKLPVPPPDSPAPACCASAPTTTPS